MFLISCILAWAASGIIGLLIIDYRFGRSAGTEDEISWAICAVLGPFAIGLALLPRT